MSRISKFAAVSAAIVALLALGVPAFAQDDRPPAPGDRGLAQQLVRSTMSSYSSYTRGSFTNTVSDDFPTDKYAFVNRVERSYYAARPSQLDFFINTANRTGNKLAVQFKWQKKSMVRASGTQRKNEGQCMFVYKNEGGQWRLYDIKGQSPF